MLPSPSSFLFLPPASFLKFNLSLVVHIMARATLVQNTTTVYTTVCPRPSVVGSHICLVEWFSTRLLETLILEATRRERRARGAIWQRSARRLSRRRRRRRRRRLAEERRAAGQPIHLVLRRRAGG